MTALAAQGGAVTTIPRTNRNSNRCGAVLRALCVAVVAHPTPPWHYLTLSQASHTLELSAFGLPCSSIHFMYQLEHQPLRNPPKFGGFRDISRTFARFAPYGPARALSRVSLRTGPQRAETVQ